MLTDQLFVTGEAPIIERDSVISDYEELVRRHVVSINIILTFPKSVLYNSIKVLLSK